MSENPITNLKQLTSRPWFWPLVLYTVSFFLRIAFLFAYRYPELLGAGIVPLRPGVEDQDTFLQLATHLRLNHEFSVIAGGEKVPFGYRPPLYPIFLMVVQMLFGTHLLIARIVQAALGSAVAPILYVAADRLGGKRAALVAGILGATYPFFIYWTGFLTSVQCCILLTTVGLMTIASYIKDPKPKTLVATIVTFALSGLFRPEGFYAAFPALLYLSIVHLRRNRMKGLRDLLLATLMVLILWAPWAYRNHRVFGVWQPLQVGVFATTLLYCSEYPYTGIDWPEKEALHEEIWQEIKGLPDSAINRHLVKRLGAFHIRHPWMTLRIYGSKFLKYWKIVPNESFHDHVKGHVVENIRAGTKIHWASIASYGLILPFLLLRLIRILRSKREELPFLLILVGSSLIGVLTVSEIRIRNNFESTVLLLAALEIALIWERHGKSLLAMRRAQ